MFIATLLMICCVAGVWISPALSEVSPSCCFDVFNSSSVNYTLSTTECEIGTWNRDRTTIKSEEDDVDKEIVTDFGQAWILLNGNYSGITFRCSTQGGNDVHCTAPCPSRKTDLQIKDPDPSISKKALIGVFVPIGIIFIIIGVIVWKCYRKRCGDAANRREANSANHAHGGFQAVGPEDQQESAL